MRGEAIFIDSNVPMYLVGADHPNKSLARRLVESAIEGRHPLVTDAEVFQEIVHRYVAIARKEAIDAAFAVLRGLADVVFPIELVDVDRARLLVRTSPLSARDALHVATMERHAIERILTFDRGFDGIPGIVRVGG